MMNLANFRLTAVLMFAAASGCALAQAPADEPDASREKPQTDSTYVTAADPIQALSGQGEAPDQYAPALDGTGLITMSKTTTWRPLISGIFSGGWDSNPSDSAKGVSSGVYTVSPYLGFQANTASTQYLIQYQPTFTGYTSSLYDHQVLNNGSAILLGTLSDRWKWDAKVLGTYGEDSVRLSAPQQNVAVGEVPGTGASNAAYLPGAGIVTYVYAGGNLHYRKSERDSIEFAATNAYSKYTGITGNNLIATTSLGYGHEVSPNLSVRGYGQSYFYYGTIHCQSFGGGVGVKWHVRDRTFFSVSGGPQLNTSGCEQQQGFAYNVAFSTRLTANSQLYFLAAREPESSYLGPGLWLVTTSGGYQRQMMNKRATLTADAGYATSSTLTVTDSYHAVYFDVAFVHPIAHGMSASYSYRQYWGESSATTINRYVSLFSFIWTPGAGRIFQ
jgi:hypothetical protein